jgi:hypothetical protein
MEQGIVTQAVRNNLPIPGKIENAPELREDLRFYYEAFLELDCERDSGFQAGAIKWSSIKEYGQFHELEEEQFENLFFFIRRMDNIRLRELSKKNE